jgi:hypothetical protein
MRHTLGSFQAFLIIQIWDKPDQVLETTLITKETTYYFDFGKYFVLSFWCHSLRAFSLLLKIHWGLSQKSDVLTLINSYFEKSWVWLAEIKWPAFVGLCNNCEVYSHVRLKNCQLDISLLANKWINKFCS